MPSGRAGELVKLGAQRLPAEALPPERHLRRYAALLVGAERYTLGQSAAANTVYLEAHQAEGAEHGVDGRENPEAARKAHHQAIQRMSQLLPVATEAQRILHDLLNLYRKHIASFPASLKRDYPDSTLSQWFLQLHQFESYLAEGIKPASRLPSNPRSKKPSLTKSQICFLWWAWASRYRGRWAHMAALAHVWGVHELRRPHAQSPKVFERHVLRLREKHKSLPHPAPWIEPADRDLFVKY